MSLDFPFHDYGLSDDTADVSRTAGREDLAIKAILAWLDTQPQDIWMHFLRSRDFAPGTLDRELGIRLAAHPSLDAANARLLFWKLFSHFPYFAPRAELMNTSSGLPALEMSLTLLAERIDSGRLTPSTLEFSAGELRSFLTPFEIGRARARARGWRRKDAPFAIPKELLAGYRGQRALVPPRFPAPADPEQAMLVMAHTGFQMSHIVASDRRAVALKRQGRRWSTFIWVALAVACGTAALSTMHNSGLI